MEEEGVTSKRIWPLTELPPCSGQIRLDSPPALVWTTKPSIHQVRVRLFSEDQKATKSIQDTSDTSSTNSPHVLTGRENRDMKNKHPEATISDPRFQFYHVTLQELSVI